MKFKNKMIIPVDLILVFLMVALDQWTKNLAVLNLKDKPAYILIKDVLHLQYLENRGAAFGMLQNAQIFFVVVGIIFAIVGLISLGVIPDTVKYRPIRVCVLMIVAGAIGNCIDRVVQNFVVDFIYFIYIDFPVFNVADIYVTVGTAVLIILIMFFYKDDELDFKSIKEKKEMAS